MNRSYPSKFLLIVTMLIASYSIQAQMGNNNQDKGAISVTLPRTPESEAIERYGNIPVSELTGTTNISVPIYTLKSRFWEVPVTLNYSASGIKVLQEASWVGLGFDLTAGGRITVETKGCIDADGVSLVSPTQLKYGFQKLLNRIGTPNNFNLLTFASPCYNCDTTDPDIAPADHWTAISGMADYGVGEPDVYRANFMGNSLNFYFNLLTDSLEFIGEKSLFDISLTKDSFGRILTWTLIDNLGSKYYFNQRESTTMTMPPLGPLVNNTATTAWLLTKMVHPSGDSIVYSYLNFGNSYPVNGKSASMTFFESERELSQSNDNDQNEVIQSPYYLAKIESNNTAVEFVLGNREDIKGTGSKRLNEIRIKDKIANVVRKKSTFIYDYFDGSLGECFTSLHDSITKYYRLRLKLNEIKILDSSSLQPPYKFYYKSVTIPHKLSVAQDHWGYYNGLGGIAEDPCSPKNLIPNTGLGTILNYPILNGYAFSREADSISSMSMMLDSIVYPTGGMTRFEFEPHVTSINAIYGAGLRIRKIKNYMNGRLVNAFEYSYSGGTYLGKLSYLRTSWSFSVCGYSYQTGDEAKHVITSHGAVNDHELTVAYGSVRLTQKDPAGKSNGYTVKTFNVPNPRLSTGGYGYNVMASHWPNGTFDDGLGSATYTNFTWPLFPDYTGFAPTPTRQLDGKLLKEEHFDNANNPVKSTHYFYTQTSYNQKYYSAQVIDNRVGGAQGTQCLPGVNSTVPGTGARRYTLFMSLAKSFFTHTDSVIEKSYHGSNVLITKKATKYNSFHQPDTEIVYNSDSTQTITFTKTSLDLSPKYSLAPTGDAILLNELKSDHIYDLPIEQTKVVRTSNGDSLVVESRVNIYDNMNLKKVYLFESPAPLTYRSQFVPLYYDYAGYPGNPTGSSYSVKMDTRYKLNSTAFYSSRSQIISVQRLKGNSAYIWDDQYDNLLAQTINADSTDIAYNSFETGAKGRWAFNLAGKTADNTSPAGGTAYSMTSGNITISGLSSLKTYVITYWRKSGGSQTVNGATGTTGLSSNNWTYVQHTIINPAGGTVTVSGTGLIDELRLFPKNALMTSFTYIPIIGINSQSDATGKISYYEYDVIGRLTRIRDINRNIIKSIAYGYGDMFTYPFGNNEYVSSASKACSTGYQSFVPIAYKVSANTYGSYLNKSDANSKAWLDVQANGQAWADATGSCNPWYSFDGVAGSGFNLVFDDFHLTGTGSVDFGFAVGKSSAWTLNTSYHVGNLTGPLFIPSTIQIVNVTAAGSNYQISFFPDGKTYIKWTGGSAPANNVASVSGIYNL